MNSEWKTDQLPEVETETGTKTSLLERAYELNFNADDIPPPEESCIYIGDDHPIAARGNLTGIQGKQKAGKSAVVSAILGSVIRGNYVGEGDLFKFAWKGASEGAVIHFDTEQSPSDWHALVRRSIARSGMHGTEGRLTSIPAVTFSRMERLSILEGILEREAQRLGKVDTVLIDGIADLCKSPNDEIESLELVSKIHSLSHIYDCPILSVLHENPGSETGKTRGHLGSELARKAFANLRVDKDPESLISTIYGTDMRKGDLPKSQGFCFGWSNDKNMHSFKGRHAGLKAAMREAEKVTSEREFFDPIFASNGTNTPCPVLTVDGALNIIRDMNGTEKTPTQGALKKRMQRAEGLGVIKKVGRGEWKLNPIGTIGT